MTTILLLLSLSLFSTQSAPAQEANVADATPTNAFSITAATYTGAVREKVAQFDATIQISTFATNQTIPLFGEDVAIEKFSAEAGDAKLLRQGHSVSLRLGERGNTTVQLKLIVKLGGDVTKRQLAFAIPPALSSKLAMTLDEAEADVEFPSAVSFKRTPDGKETRVDAILGSGDRVEMFWTPRVKSMAEMAASIFAQNTTLVTIGGGVVNTRAVLDYQVSQGELKQAKVRLPSGQRLLRVEGELIRTWELNDEGNAQILIVDLVKGATLGYRLTVETEKALDKLPTTVPLDTPHVMDVIREVGLAGVRGTEELSLTIESTTDLQRVDAAEFGKASSLKAEGVMSAYRFLKAGFQLSVRAEAIQPQVEAVVRNSIRVGFEQVNVFGQVDYTIKKAGLFTLRLALPAGYKVDGVTGGDGRAPAWTEKENPRVLEVTLKERTMGAFTLHVGLTKQHKELPKTIDVAGVAPLETQKLTGFVSVSSEPGVAVKTTSFDGLTEIPAASLGDGKPSGGGSVQAYKFVGTDPQTAATWKLSVATETVESWIRAETVNIVSVSETLVSGRALVRYDIQNAPVKEFRLRVPSAYTNVEIFGPNIRRRDQTNDVWRVELQNKVRGAFTLTVTWEQRRAATNALLDVAGVEAISVERETGSVVLMARPPLQVAEQSATEHLIKIDAREMPEWSGVGTAATAGGEVPVLVYRYLRPGYKLAVSATRYQDADVLQALVDSARLTTVVADDGQIMTEMTLGIRNNGKQHLEIELPDTNMVVWSVFVAGQPVRPSRNAGKLMIPLERSSGEDAPIAVELTYIGGAAFPKGKGVVRLASPKLDVPLKNARWDVYLPPDYDYTKFEGSMVHEADSAPVVQVYSSSEYFRQEETKKTAKQMELRNFLGNARSSLSSGKLSGANNDFNQALRFNEADGDGVAKKELEVLKRDLGRAQSSNLINAQRAYTYDNVNRYADASGGQQAKGKGGQQGQQAAEMVLYDAEVAEQQWDALQRAQEISVAKVQPLRANLPTRGLRHAFSQVLQTEVNKPMTIQLTATNIKKVGLFRQGIYFVAGFLMLWIFVSVVVTRRRVDPARAT